MKTLTGTYISPSNLLDLPDNSDSESERILTDVESSCSESDGEGKENKKEMYSAKELFEDAVNEQVESSGNLLSLLSGSFGTNPAETAAPSPISTEKPQSELQGTQNDDLLELLSGGFSAVPQDPANDTNSESLNQDLNAHMPNKPLGDASAAAAEFASRFNQLAESAPKPVPAAARKFIDQEAEVEEDEFMNYGGIDGEDLNAPNEYDKSMVSDTKVRINEKAIMELHRYH